MSGLTRLTSFITISKARLSVIRELSTDIREPRTATGSRMCPFLAWFCSLPQTGKALVDDCGSSLQTRLRENAPKRKKIQFPGAMHGSKCLCLSSLLSPYQKLLRLPCTNFQTIDIAIHSTYTTRQHLNCSSMQDVWTSHEFSLMAYFPGVSLESCEENPDSFFPSMPDSVTD